MAYLLKHHDNGIKEVALRDLKIRNFIQQLLSNFYTHDKKLIKFSLMILDVLTENSKILKEEIFYIAKIAYISIDLIMTRKDLRIYCTDFLESIVTYIDAEDFPKQENTLILVLTFMMEKIELFKDCSSQYNSVLNCILAFLLIGNELKNMRKDNKILRIIQNNFEFLRFIEDSKLFQNDEIKELIEEILNEIN